MRHSLLVLMGKGRLFVGPVVPKCRPSTAPLCDMGTHFMGMKARFGGSTRLPSMVSLNGSSTAFSPLALSKGNRVGVSCYLLKKSQIRGNVLLPFCSSHR